jgi:hypothetical protein
MECSGKYPGQKIRHRLTLQQRDGLQWVIEECYKTDNPAHLKPAQVGHRLLCLNFVSMHSTSFTVANVIQDLFSSSQAMAYVESLRDECTRVLAEADGAWTKEAVSRLHRVDSAIRESMRMSNFGVLALPRRVSFRLPFCILVRSLLIKIGLGTGWNPA